MYIFTCHQPIVKRFFFYCIIFLVTGFPFYSSAQLWNGNLGAPVLNMTFGTGRSQPLPTNTSSYTYTGGCPSPGKYSIEHFLFGCETGTWIMLTGDHTKDHDGNYMLVNGATEPATVYMDTITGLCGNTTYQLSAWISNCMQNTACGGKPVLTNLTLSIETIAGAVLASYNTGDIATTDSKVWKEYGVYCTTPVTPIPLVVRIKNISGGACGSAFIMDDITLKPAGPSITVNVNGATNAPIDLCMGYTNTYTLQGTYSTAYADPVLQWQRSVDTGRTWQNIPGATTTTYISPHRDDSVILYHLGVAERSNSGNSKCSIYSEDVYTNVHKLPDHSPLKKVLGCLDKKLTITSPPEFSAFLWTRPNGLQSSDPYLVIPNLQNADAGLYTVKLTANFGCYAVDSFLVNIFPGTTISTNTLYNVCEGVSVNLSATGDGTYEWSPAKGLSNALIANPVANSTDSIQYKVVLTNSYGCKDSALVNINVFKKLVVRAGTDKTILSGDSVLLDGFVSGTAVNYFWAASPSINNTSLLQPLVYPVVETSYTLNAISTVGCGATSATTSVHVFKDIFMPAAFTPNGDGLNDIYHMFTLDSYKLISFTIFNRYGSKIFSTTSSKAGWDGTLKGQPQETGQYVYYLQLKHPSGKNITRKGTILLLR